MPLQNRVTPTGQIIADPARGLVMGNRGCLHDDQRQVLSQYRVKRWIICHLAFKGRRRQLMTPGKYTELFFLDEATALAAGHRPCAECNRERFQTFGKLWMEANPGVMPGDKLSADVLDAHLHRERISTHYYQRDKEKLTYETSLDDLPDGAFIVFGNAARPHLVYGGALYPWSPGGYGPPVARPMGAMSAVLTPPSTVQALAYGYTSCIHPSATEAYAKGGTPCDKW
ncbi:MAG: hypothetical protein HGA45_14005 [Chloroflexales bacterium]|nr:hypothetical protein [Chloroflexales bacterium]